MSYLLDTCTLVWLASKPERISSKAAAIINDPDSVLVLSDVSVWEVCLKSNAGKLKLPQPPRAWCEQQSLRWRLTALTITREVIYRTTELPDRHRDPFDRLLVAQCLEDKLSILSPDEQIAGYPISVIW